MNSDGTVDIYDGIGCDHIMSGGSADYCLPMDKQASVKRILFLSLMRRLGVYSYC